MNNLKIAYNYLNSFTRYKERKELMYINMEDGEIEIASEIEEIAHQVYLKKKEEY